MDAIPGASSATLTTPDGKLSCSHTISSLWLQNQLLRDRDLAFRSVVDCPLWCGGRFEALLAVVDHIPRCERLQGGKYWCWVRGVQVEIPMLCQCQLKEAQGKVKREESFETFSAAPGSDTPRACPLSNASNSFQHSQIRMEGQQTHLGYQHSLQSPRRLSSASKFPALIHNQRYQPLYPPQLGETSALQQDDSMLSSFGLGSNPDEYVLGSFEKPWTDTQNSSNQYCQSPGAMLDGSSILPHSSTADVATTSYGSSAAIFPQSTRQNSNRSPPPPHTQQDGLFSNLKACFYTVLQRECVRSNKFLGKLKRLPSYNILVGSLRELGRLISQSERNSTGPAIKLCLGYLALAMALALQQYLRVELPEELLETMESELSNLLDNPGPGVLSHEFVGIFYSFLDVFQGYLKDELMTTCDLSCACIIPHDASLVIIGAIRNRFPTILIPETDQTSSPIQQHRTIRSLELELLRLRPEKLPCLSASVSELSSRTFFTEYIPFVRQQCDRYYCQHFRAKYHVWVIRLICRGLGAQEDAPQRSIEGHDAAAAGTPARFISSQSSTSFTLQDPNYLRLTVDRASSPMVIPDTAPVTIPTASKASATTREHGLPCAERGCNYVAPGSNAKKLLKRHRDALHNPNKQRLPCRFCEKNFTRKDNLKAHIMKKHPGEGYLNHDVGKDTE